MKKIRILFLLIFTLTSCAKKFEPITIHYEFDADDATPIHYADDRIYFTLDNYAETFTSLSTQSIGYFDLETKEYKELFNLEDDTDRVWNFVAYDDSVLYTRLIQKGSDLIPIYEVTYRKNGVDQILHSGKAIYYESIPVLKQDNTSPFVYFISQNTLDSEEVCLFGFNMEEESSESIACYPMTKFGENDSFETLSNSNIYVTDSSISFVTQLRLNSIINEYDTKEFSFQKYPQDYLIDRALSLKNNLYFEYINDSTFASKTVSKDDQTENNLPSFFNRLSIEDNVIYFTDDGGTTVNSYDDRNGKTIEFENYNQAIVGTSFPYVYKGDHIITVNSLKLGKVVIQIFD